MKLISFVIQNYKSVEDSGTVEVENVTCLVGKNEAGKTTLMEALSKLKPTSGQPSKFELEDFPRRKLTDYKKKHESNPATAVTASYAFEKDEMKALEETFGVGCFVGKTVSISKTYKNQYSWNPEINEQAYIKHVIALAGVDGNDKTTFEGSSSISELKVKLSKIEAPSTAVQKLKKELDKISDKGLSSSIWAVILESLPEFFYFDEYSTLPGEVSLAKLKEAEANGTTSENLLTALALLKLVGSKADEFLQRQNYERLKADLEAASNKITEQVFKYWTQNKNLEVEFDLDPVTNQQGQLIDTTLKIRIKNTRHKVTVPFDKRSKGFVWFFSFLVAFSDYKEQGDDVILLLDEPGLNLHAKAQEDLLTFIDDELAPNHQVIYTTHSPFLVPANALTSVRTVQDTDDKGTIVSNDPLKNDPDTVYPLQAAMGYDIAQTLFIGPNNLLVEGPSDLLYFSIASQHLIELSKVGLSEKWVIVPIGGADKVATFVSLLKGNKLNIGVFLDISKKGKQRIDSLITSGLLEKKKILTPGFLLGNTEADIEDLFDAENYLEVVNKLYEKELSGKKLTSADLAQGGQRIVKKIEDYFKSNNVNGGEFSHYRPSNLVTRDLELQKKLFNLKTLERFEKVFSHFNGFVTSQ
jgi:predicted ATP-dependent endonuclease of OLD family